jgi:opacity protein-like surface antigen
MKRTLTVLAAAALASCVLAPAATAANESPSPKQVANQFCHDQKKQMKADTGDNKAFKELYGGKRAMQTCKRQNQGEAETAVENSSQECKTEQESDPVAFAETYGDKKNAHGKCVSAKSKEKSDEQAEETSNAAQECDAERDADEEAFAQTYGTEESKRKNAFGKCVSQKVREDEGETAPTA